MKTKEADYTPVDDGSSSEPDGEDPFLDEARKMYGPKGTDKQVEDAAALLRKRDSWKRKEGQITDFDPTGKKIDISKMNMKKPKAAKP